MCLQCETIEYRNAISDTSLGALQIGQDLDELGSPEAYEPKKKGTFLWVINDLDNPVTLLRLFTLVAVH